MSKKCHFRAALSLEIDWLFSLVVCVNFNLGLHDSLAVLVATRELSQSGEQARVFVDEGVITECARLWYVFSNEKRKQGRGVVGRGCLCARACLCAWARARLRVQDILARATHLDWVHARALADHAQVVLLSALHVVFAVLPYGSSNPLPARVPGLGRHGRNTYVRVYVGVGLLALAVAVVGLFALKTIDQVVAAFATVEALEDGDPHGLHARLLLRLRRGVTIR